MPLTTGIGERLNEFGDDSVKCTIGVVGLTGMSAFLSVDHFHRPEETVQANDLFMEPGGKAFNQAAAARKLGAEVMLISCVGADDNARVCREYLAAQGIRFLSLISETEGTAFASILTDSAGRNQVTVFPGASGALSADFVYRNKAAIRECDFMLLGLECPIEATEAAMECAREAGIPVILNPAPAKPLEIRWLRRCFCITPNRDEACGLLGIPAGSPVSRIAEDFQKSGLEHVLVTLGADGVLLVEPERILRIPSVRVPVADTTGAGDTFNAALAVELACGKSIPEAAVYAVRAAACSVRKKHVLTSLPDREEVEKIPVLAPEIYRPGIYGDPD